MPKFVDPPNAAIAAEVAEQIANLMAKSSGMEKALFFRELDKFDVPDPADVDSFGVLNYGYRFYVLCPPRGLPRIWVVNFPGADEYAIVNLSADRQYGLNEVAERCATALDVKVTWVQEGSAL